MNASATQERRIGKSELMTFVYEEHSDALFRFVLRKTAGDRQSAEDIVQETMFRLWRRISRTDFDREIRPLLFAIARNLLIDRHRARQIRPVEVNEPDLPEVAIGDETETCLSRIVLDEALASLSTVHRGVVIETYLADRKIRDTAKVLGLPEGTVKSRMHYALREMRTTLTGLGIAADDCAA